MRKTILLALAIVASASFSTLSAKDKKEKKVVPPTTEQKVVLKSANDSLSYVSGMALTNGLMPFLKQNFGVTDADMPNVIEGFKEAIAKRNDPKMKGFQAGQQIAQMVDSRMLPGLQKEFTIGTDSLNDEMVFNGFLASLNNDTTYYTLDEAEKVFAQQRVAYKNRADSLNKKAGEDFLAENKKQPGVVTLPSGLQYKVLTKGTGAIPKATDKVQVVYEGTTIDGKVFDATSKHGGAKFDTFTPQNLIKGWQEALTLMPVGSKWQLFIPYNLAYGERGAGRDIAPYSALIFTMELKGIEEPKAESANGKTINGKPSTTAGKAKAGKAATSTSKASKPSKPILKKAPAKRK